jgi:hypothetical protein
MVEYEELERSLNPLETNFVVNSDAPDERRDFRTASKREGSEIEDFRKGFLILVVLEILLVGEDVEGGRVSVPEDLGTMVDLGSTELSV